MHSSIVLVILNLACCLNVVLLTPVKDSDFVDFDEILLDRSERSPKDYSAGGGPLAAASGPLRPTPGPNGAPITAPRTTASPNGQANPAAGDDNEVLIDQCKEIQHDGGTGRARGPPPKSGKSREYKIETKAGLVLEAIHNNQAKPNDYLTLKNAFCSNLDQCVEECKKEGCNYFLRHNNKKTNLAFLYNIRHDIMNNKENYVRSNGFDSFLVTSSDPDASSGHRSQRSVCAPCNLGIFCSLLCGGDLTPLLADGATGGGAPAPAPAPRHEPFDDFSQNFRKKYKSDEERRQANENYRNNKRKNEEANKKNDKPDDAKQSVTKFSDMTYEKFASTFMGAKVDHTEKPVPFHEADPEPLKLLKLQWDMAAKGSVPPVRYQGSCGSCYAFTTADLVATQNAIERHQALKDMQTQELSVQYLIDCGGINASAGCQGGRPSLLLKNIQKSDGIPFESCYRYIEGAGNCQVDKAQKCCRRQSVKFSQMVDVEGPNEKDLIAKILHWGPAIAIIDASEQWMFYAGDGIIKARQCNPNRQNHAVIIAGYNFEPSNPTPYYLIRNSWGGDWGVNGYAKLEAGKNACGVAKYVTVACTGDCRDVKSVKDLMQRSNVPPSMMIQSSSSGSHKYSVSSSVSSSSSSSSTGSKQAGSNGQKQQEQRRNPSNGH